MCWQNIISVPRRCRCIDMLDMVYPSLPVFVGNTQFGQDVVLDSHPIETFCGKKGAGGEKKTGVSGVPVNNVTSKKMFQTSWQTHPVEGVDARAC